MHRSEIAYLVCRGGWPVAVGQHGDMALERAQEYYEATVETDISKERNLQGTVPQESGDSRNPLRMLQKAIDPLLLLLAAKNAKGTKNMQNGGYWHP